MFARLSLRTSLSSSFVVSLRYKTQETSSLPCQTWVRNIFTQCEKCGHILDNIHVQPGRLSNVYSQHVRQFITKRNKGLALKSKPPAEPTGPGGVQTLIRPFLFTSLVCCGSFTGAMIWQYENMRGQAKKLIKGPEHTTDRRMRKIGFRENISQLWYNLSSGQKMVCGIIATNVLVFLLWKVPALTPVMSNYFASTPISSAPCLSMILSVFSHYNLWHLAANMYVLWSFSSITLSLLGKEQFLAVYFSAGAVSSFTSYAFKVARTSFVPSLGASGALMAILGAVCVSYPDARLAVAFVGDLIPHSFSAESAMKALITFDTVGLVLGWRLFDHAAHLGGIMFGLWYIKFGQHLIWGNREPVMQAWHKLRGKP